MKRSMSRQAEAERERRSRVIIAEGELQASEKLSQATEVMTVHPAALQLRLLQTVVEVAAEKNSTLVLPFPVELLRFLERATPTNRSVTSAARIGSATAPGRDVAPSEVASVPARCVELAPAGTRAVGVASEGRAGPQRDTDPGPVPESDVSAGQASR
jgi:hypothetical protein